MDAPAASASSSFSARRQRLSIFSFSAKSASMLCTSRDARLLSESQTIVQSPNHLHSNGSSVCGSGAHSRSVSIFRAKSIPFQ